MAKFTTRIQLQEADEKDYINLQNELQQRSIKTTRKPLAKSNVHVTANGEYNLEGNVTIQEVTDVVLKAAAKTGKKYSFTIIRNKHLNSYDK
jgi:hypothetical protein